MIVTTATTARILLQVTLSTGKYHYFSLVTFFLLTIISRGIYGREYNVIDLQAEKLSHILYAFANVNQDGTILLGVKIIILLVLSSKN